MLLMKKQLRADKWSKETLIKEKEAVALKLKELGVEENLINLPGMTQGMLVILGQKILKNWVTLQIYHLMNWSEVMTK